MEVQAVLGAEIAMAFDECAPGEATSRRNTPKHGADAALGQEIKGGV